MFTQYVLDAGSEFWTNNILSPVTLFLNVSFQVKLFNMTSIKHILQKEVFLPNEERLVGMVNVTQSGKKKKGSKNSFLCVSSM